MGNIDSVEEGPIFKIERTEEDIKITDKFDLTCFFKITNLSDFQYVISHKKSYLKIYGPKYNDFVIYHKRTFYPELLSDSENQDLQKIECLLAKPSSEITPEDLDGLWILYYASGDRKFPIRVLEIAKDVSSTFLIAGAARWSYNSHVQQGFLEE